jgi:nitronate monooxygenase
LLAGMGGVARSALVAAVCNAGGFGTLGMVREPPNLIADEIARVRERTTAKFGVNLIPAATPAELLEAEVRVCLEMRVPSVTLFWDLAENLVRRLSGAGVTVLCQVGTAAEAEAAVRAGAQAIIAQGYEAGGHVRGLTALSALLPDVAAAVDVPVVAAGGIVDGAGMAAARALGADGVMLGTAFLATQESFAHDYHKARIVAAQADETIHTDLFQINWPRGAMVRVLQNSATRGERGDPSPARRDIIGDEEGRPIYLFSTDSPLRSMTGDFEAMALYAGQGAARIHDIPSAAERLERILREASEAAHRVHEEADC